MERRTKPKRKLKSKPINIPQIDLLCNDPFTKCLGYIGHLHGLKKIILSPSAQEFVGCRIGIEITSLTPWMFVEADRIRKSIELYQNTSDFCSIKPFMERYREPEVLMGCYYVGSADQEQEFYICTTRRAMDEVIKILRKERKDCMTNVYNTFSFDALFWQTANENDVKKRHSGKRRSLYEVEVNLPISKTKRKLSTRTVQEALDGYAEFPSKHEKYKNITRRRYDGSTQSSNTTDSKKTNTNKRITKNMFSQYKQELDKVEKIYAKR